MCPSDCNIMSDDYRRTDVCCYGFKQQTEKIKNAVLAQVLLPAVTDEMTLVNNASFLLRQFYCIYHSSSSPEESNSTCGGCLDFCGHVI